MLMYDRDNRQQVANVRKLFEALITETARAGYGEYRTHLGWMDAVNCYRRALSMDYRADRSVKLASALERAGLWQDARLEAQRSLRMNPDSRYARQIIERVRQRLPDQ